MQYCAKVMDHYTRPRNVGTLDKTASDVGTGTVGSPVCGDVMRLQIRVNDDGHIVEAKFKTFGCGSAIASSSWLAEWLVGKSLDEALALKNTVIAKDLALPPVKLHCSVLAAQAAKAAILDFRKKQGIMPTHEELVSISCSAEHGASNQDDDQDDTSDALAS